MPDAQIVVNVYNSARQPLGADVKVLVRLSAKPSRLLHIESQSVVAT